MTSTQDSVVHFLRSVLGFQNHSHYRRSNKGATEKRINKKKQEMMSTISAHIESDMVTFANFMIKITILSSILNSASL